ncbi:MOS1T transposase, partial [Pseudoatta argentina]
MTCRDWFRRFKNNDFQLEDKERSGAPKKFQDKELEQLLDIATCYDKFFTPQSATGFKILARELSKKKKKIARPIQVFVETPGSIEVTKNLANRGKPASKLAPVRLPVKPVTNESARTTKAVTESLMGIRIFQLPTFSWA